MLLADDSRKALKYFRNLGSMDTNGKHVEFSKQAMS